MNLSDKLVTGSFLDRICGGDSNTLTNGNKLYVRKHPLNLGDPTKPSPDDILVAWWADSEIYCTPGHISGPRVRASLNKLVRCLVGYERGTYTFVRLDHNTTILCPKTGPPYELGEHEVIQLTQEGKLCSHL